MYQAYKNTELGMLFGKWEEGLLICLEFCDKANETKNIEGYAQETFQQLEEYFQGIRREFSIPMKLAGTEFQRIVWEELIKIPYGETRTYKDIAISVGNPKAARAVGRANHINPIPVIVPCHRVIGSNHKLTGYAYGLEMKKKLLAIENTSILS